MTSQPPFTPTLVSAAERAALLDAVNLARRGPQTGGNPRVGCVLLDADGRVLAEGWHEGTGSAHAEVAAIADLARRHPGVTPHTAVVTLEPCRHHGRTPPCTDALISAGVRRVIYGQPDPGPESGGGATVLAAHGVEVVEGDSTTVGPEVAHATADLIESWRTAVTRGRPWLIVKWAQSLDGRIAAADGSSQWITDIAARAHVHAERGTVDAILTTTGTVLSDDPALTARGDAPRRHQPHVVVLGNRPTPADARVRQHPAGVTITGDRDVTGALAALAQRGATRVLVEAGPSLLSELLRFGLADEVLVYIAPVVIGGPRTAITELGVSTLDEAPRFDVVETRSLGDDVVLRMRPRARPAHDGVVASPPSPQEAR